MRGMRLGGVAGLLAQVGEWLPNGKAGQVRNSPAERISLEEMALHEASHDGTPPAGPSSVRATTIIGEIRDHLRCRFD